MLGVISGCKHTPNRLKVCLPTFIFRPEGSCLELMAHGYFLAMADAARLCWEAWRRVR